MSSKPTAPAESFVDALPSPFRRTSGRAQAIAANAVRSLWSMRREAVAQLRFSSAPRQKAWAVRLAIQAVDSGHPVRPSAPRARVGPGLFRCYYNGLGNGSWPLRGLVGHWHALGLQRWFRSHRPYTQPLLAGMSNEERHRGLGALHQHPRSPREGARERDAPGVYPSPTLPLLLTGAFWMRVVEWAHDRSPASGMAGAAGISTPVGRAQAYNFSVLETVRSRRQSSNSCPFCPLPLTAL